WFAPLIAALVGAAIGVATAAIVGQSLWQGALVGAIGGLAFNGVGSLMLKGIAQTAAHGFAGAAVGAIGGAIEGGDVGRGALVGLFSASIANGLGQAAQGAGMLAQTGESVAGNIQNGLVQTGIGAVVGGGTSAAFGGSFGQGAALGAMTAGIGYATNQAMHVAEEIYGKFALYAYRAEKGGHAAIGLGSKEAIFRGWYPKTKIGRVEAMLGGQREGMLIDDIKFISQDGVAKHFWDITKRQYNQVITYMNKFQADNKVWSLSVNCTDFAVGAARSIGINVPDITTNGYSDPAKLGKWLDSLN
ncbi:MAG: hypothetical protein AB1755_06645, partial [Candidatus Omnitrophota bacterium]